MTNFLFQWKNILDLAEAEGIPKIKKKGILREYFQALFLKFLYSQKHSKNLHFIGGTSLRLIHGLDRFSEDLDFENHRLSTAQLKKLFDYSAEMIKKQGFDLDFSFKITVQKHWQGFLKFGGGLLKELDIVLDQRQKLVVRIDVIRPLWFVQRRVFFMNKFGVSENVVSNSLETIAAQKSFALLSRKSPRGRDIYDVFWLVSRNIKPNLKTLKFAKINNYQEYKEKILQRTHVLKPKFPQLKRQLRPFLVNEENIRYLDLLEPLIQKKF